MPFDFLRRKPSPPEGGTGQGSTGQPQPGSVAGGGAPGAGAGRRGRPVAFDALTEEWRLTGTMWIEGRLSDALNRRESIEISDVTWSPIDRSAAPEVSLRGIAQHDCGLVL